jgi:hypothetical protein
MGIGLEIVVAVSPIGSDTVSREARLVVTAVGQVKAATRFGRTDTGTTNELVLLNSKASKNLTTATS